MYCNWINFNVSSCNFTSIDLIYIFYGVLFSIIAPVNTYTYLECISEYHGYNLLIFLFTLHYNAGGIYHFVSKEQTEKCTENDAS